MCTYNVVIEDSLAVKAEHLLNGISLQDWMKQQIEALVSQAGKVQSNNSTSRRLAKVKKRSAVAPSDHQLEAYFAKKAMPLMPEDPSWKDVIDSNAGRIIKPLEKWL